MAVCCACCNVDMTIIIENIFAVHGPLLALAHGQRKELFQQDQSYWITHDWNYVPSLLRNGESLLEELMLATGSGRICEARGQTVSLCVVVVNMSSAITHR